MCLLWSVSFFRNAHTERNLTLDRYVASFFFFPLLQQLFSGQKGLIQRPIEKQHYSFSESFCVPGIASRTHVATWLCLLSVLVSFDRNRWQKDLFGHPSLSSGLCFPVPRVRRAGSDDIADGESLPFIRAEQ